MGQKLNPVLLIDGDQFIYRATSAVEKEVRWDDQNHVLFSNSEEAWDVFEGSLEKVKDTLDADVAYLAFTGKGNFRKELYPSYKAHRKNTRKPMCYSSVYERALKTYQCYSVDGLEADDLLGIWATSGRFGYTLVVSDDKDMLTLPAVIYRNNEIIIQPKSNADSYWLSQTLTGDTADGYPGCPGVGKVKAEKLLSEFWNDEVFHTNEAWKAVVRTFEASGLSEEDALVQARLARILRVSDWDAEKKEVILWSPEVM